MFKRSILLQLSMIALLILSLLTACTKASLSLGEASQQIFNSDEAISLRVPLFSSSQALPEISWTQSLGKRTPFNARYENGYAILELEPQATTTQLYFQFRLSASVSGQTSSQTYDFFVVNPKQLKPLSLDYSQSQNAHQCKLTKTQSETKLAQLSPVFPNIRIAGAVALIQAPDDNSYWYALYREDKKLLRFANTKDASKLEEVIDLKSIRGLPMGMAFHPDFKNNGKLYIHTTSALAADEAGVVREFYLDSSGKADPTNSIEILRFNSPVDAPEKRDHPGGTMNFGPDGYLYIAFGDGTKPGHFNEVSQQLDSFSGKLIRIDVDSARPYAIPSDNPFPDAPRPEIYALGLRHPWKWSFDRLSGEIWLGDVGFNSREEINRIESGANYGWPVREGMIACPNCQIDGTYDPASFENPILDYDHRIGRSVTGGYVYRGQALSQLYGSYIYGDFIEGKVWALSPKDNGWNNQLLDQKAIGLASFAEQVDGELFTWDYFSGQIFQLSPAQKTNKLMPERLSETGCIDLSQPLMLPAGAYPYEVQRAFWSDRADKYRWFFLPETKIGLPTNMHMGLDFPPGSVLVKHFILDNKSIETRLLVRSLDNSWVGHSYEWNEEQSEAYLLADAKDRQLAEQIWHYPSASECLQCHTPNAGYALGANISNLNLIASLNGKQQSQLLELKKLNIFANEVPFQAHFGEPDNDIVSLNRQAREYLEVNCSGCHRPDAPAGRAQLDFLSSTPLAETQACNVSSWIDDLGLPNALIIAPGKPESSILLKRLSSRDSYQMPPLGSNVVPEDGVQLIERWIRNLKNCN